MSGVPLMRVCTYLRRREVKGVREMRVRVDERLGNKARMAFSLKGFPEGEVMGDTLHATG